MTVSDAQSFRAALQQRIRNLSAETGIDRYRKEVGFQRLLARLVAVGDGRWAVKGGVALLWRVGIEARATRDIANWASSTEELETLLDRVVARGVGDWFAFEIGKPTPLRGEGDGGLRFGVMARLDGREFTRFHFDVNLVSEERPTEIVRVSVPVLAFAGLADLLIPMLAVGSQVSEKLHAVGREYGSGESSRAKDVYDTVLLAQAGLLPPRGTLRDAMVQTYGIRATAIPTVPKPPTSWSFALGEMLKDHPVPGVENVGELVTVWERIWQPVLAGDILDTAAWDASMVSWDS